MENINSILQAKEQRATLQQQLSQQMQLPLISVKANFPGMHKYNGYTLYVVQVIVGFIKVNHSVVYEQNLHSHEGNVVLLGIKLDPIACKQAMITIEEHHPLGRLVDIDVIDQQNQISRSDLQINPRSCFICDQPAMFCVVNQTHTPKQVQAFFTNTVHQFLMDNPVEMIRFALLSELALTPKFGLVTPFSPGVHTDMDADTFLKSIEAITPYFREVANIDLNQETKQLFNQLREIGKPIEKAMFKATNGTNTHKGAIFLFLIVLLAQRLANDYQSLDQMIRLIAQPVMDDFIIADPSQPLTAGQKQFIEHGAMGIRGFVLAGGQPLLTKALNLYAKTNDPFDQSHQVNTLLLIMSELEDSTIIKKVGLDGLKAFQQQAKAVMFDQDRWETFEAYCIKHQLSGGGSADVLALVIYLTIDKITRGNQ